MKKLSALILLTSLIAASATSLIIKDNFINQAEATNIEYVDLGPGVYNPNQTPDLGPAYTPPENFQPQVYSIAYRGGEDTAALMLFPSKGMYADIPFNVVVNDNELVDTSFAYVRVYTDEEHYQTLDYYLSGLHPVSYNIYSDAAQNVSIFLDRRKLPTASIYQVVFCEGFVFPYASEDHSTKYVLKETMTFRNNSYGETSKADIIYAFEWTKIMSSDMDDGGEEGIQTLPIAAFSVTSARTVGGNLEDYRLQIRGGHVTAEDFEHPEESLNNDDHSCSLYIFFGDNDYNPDINDLRNVPVDPLYFDISDSETSFIHTMYEKIIFTTSSGETLTLKDVSNPFTKGLPTYNANGEYGCLVFKIGNDNAPTDTNYNGFSFATVQVLRGCQFPSAKYTMGLTSTEYRYEQIDDITVSLSSFRYALWSTYAEHVFVAADIDITNVCARDINISTPELTLKGTAIDIGLSECNYEDVANQQILTVSENMTRYIYVNGRAIYYAYGDENLSAYANLDGKTDTISIIIPEETASNVKEIIVERGCSIPSLVASSTTMEIYGGYVSYYVQGTASYALKDGTYQETEKIYWTLWFDGKNPIRVSNGSTFDFSESAPKGETTDKKRFVKWQDESGNDVVGYMRITSGKECFGVYVYSYTVEIKNVDKEISIIVERNTRLTNVDEMHKYIVPVREGYLFQGYVDEKGNHYNMDNRVTRDIVLTATWIATTEVVQKTTTNTPLIIGIVIASLAVVILGVDLAIFFVFRKKKS